MPKVKRPLPVTVLAILELCLAGLAILGILALNFEAMRHVRWSVESFTVILLLLAIVELALAYGFLSGKNWAWMFGLLFAVLGTAVSIFSLYLTFRPGGLLYLIIDLIVIYYLMQPRVQQYFHREKPRK